MIQNIHVGAVLLAAGASSRMGQPKLLLPWGGTSVLAHLIAVWRQLDAAHIAVVCAPGQNALSRELDRLCFPVCDRIVNPAPGQGMFHSIQCAAEWSGWPPHLTHCALALGDQPHVPTRTLRRLLEFAAAQPMNICQPSRAGHGRHPVIFPLSVFRMASSATGPTLKEFLSAHSGLLARIPLDDPALDLDLDTPSDYARALAAFPPLLNTISVEPGGS